jgi:hypothetical protein
MNGTLGNGGVRFKALLWAGAAFLGPFIEKVAEKLTHDTWPSPPLLLLACLTGGLQVFIVLRSYYDGSAQRHEDAKKADDQKKDITKQDETTVPKAP